MDDSMKAEIDKSEFFHFGILPQVCIHSPIEDEYSKSYIPQDVCECGCKEWVEGCRMIIGLYPNGIPITKEVHRCKECNEVRMAHHIGVLEHDRSS